MTYDILYDMAQDRYAEGSDDDSQPEALGGASGTGTTFAMPASDDDEWDCGPKHNASSIIETITMCPVNECVARIFARDA